MSSVCHYSSGFSVGDNTIYRDVAIVRLKTSIIGHSEPEKPHLDFGRKLENQMMYKQIQEI